MKNENFKAVLIDPSVITGLYSDFLGVNSVALPALYDLFVSKNIALLDCKTMHQIIKNDVADSLLDFELQQVRQYFDGLEILKPLGKEVDDAVKTLANLDLTAMLDARFEQLYANAIIMPPCDIDDMLSAYYAKCAPFDGADDSFDGTDAFLLLTFVNFAKQHSADRFLVITHNDCWKKTLQGMENVVVAQAVEQLLENSLTEKDLANQLFKRMKRKILDSAEPLVRDYDYCLADCSSEVDAEVKIDSVYFNNHDVFPLLVDENKVTYRVFVDLDVYGSYKYIGCKVSESWHTLNCCTAFATLEVTISFDREDVAHTAKLTQLKIIDRGAINVYLRNDDEDYD